MPVIVADSPLVSTPTRILSNMPEADKLKEHAERQRLYFDQKVSAFTLPIPQSVQERTKMIVHSVKLDDKSQVLDVGTGTGALIEHLLQAGVKSANIVGCDLSPKMLAQAKSRYPEVRFWQGDVFNFPQSFGLFDAIFFNACFGNLLDQPAVLIKAKTLLACGGQIIISHPMGANFVKALNLGEPEIVPHLLPEAKKLKDLAEKLTLRITTFIDEPNLYIAVLAT